MNWQLLPAWRPVVAAVASAAAWLAAASVIVWLLEGAADVADASSAYLLAVVGSAVASGTLGAVVAAVGAFLLYDFLFTRPVHSLLVTDPQEWLTLLILLFVGIVVGRLAARERDRAVAAARREREAVATFRISYTLALAPSTTEALAPIASILASEARFERVWIALGGDDATERVAADSAAGALPSFATVVVLRRRPGDEPAEWVRVHAPSRTVRPADERVQNVHRVFIESGGKRLGSIWATRGAGNGAPTREETRLVSAAADQVARALERDALAGQAVDAEVARRSDRLKSALLESVSHDLRTPLAAIRAAAGSLVDPEVKWRSDEVRSVAASIDRDAERLSTLVANLLDLSRIEGGALLPERQAFVLADLVDDAVERLRPLLANRRVDVEIAADLPPVMVDPVYVDQALGNVLENAVSYTPGDAPIVVSARVADPGHVELVIEDGGPGVTEDALPRIFERFFRVAGRRETARRGTGIGLTVVRGLIEASGGTVEARRSQRLGGLAIEIRLPVAAVPLQPSVATTAPQTAGASVDREKDGASPAQPLTKPQHAPR